jgi:hypothetical protein
MRALGSPASLAILPTFSYGSSAIRCQDSYKVQKKHDDRSSDDMDGFKRFLGTAGAGYTDASSAAKVMNVAAAIVLRLITFATACLAGAPNKSPILA